MMKPMMIGLLVTLLVGTGSVAATQDQAPKRVLWEKRPIPLHIQVNQERIVHFPDDIRYWLPDSLKSKVSVIAANGVLYLRALEPFLATRIRVQSLKDRQIFLLDVSANSTASEVVELVVMTADAVDNQAKKSSQAKPIEDWRVRLTRYAAQQLYAPERLLRGDSGIQRVALPEKAPVPLIRGGRVEATPIAAWKGGGLYVTAIKLRNTTSQSLSLGFGMVVDEPFVDLRDALRGQWQTTSVQHHQLGAADTRTDTTMLYLVSQHPFVESANIPDVSAQNVEGVTDGR